MTQGIDAYKIYANLRSEVTNFNRKIISLLALKIFEKKSDVRILTNYSNLCKRKNLNLLIYL